MSSVWGWSGKKGVAYRNRLAFDQNRVEEGVGQGVRVALSFPMQKNLRPRVLLYIATSLDGYIADTKGGVGWLERYAGKLEGVDYGYYQFYDSVDRLVMGRGTYDQVRTFGDWPYPGKPSHIFTSRLPEQSDNPDVFFTDKSPAELLAEIPATDTVWLVGGGRLVAAFREADLIDEYIITLIPVLLGDGIPLFVPAGEESPMELKSVESYDDGVVNTHYSK